jgi:mevalonate kinase
MEILETAYIFVPAKALLFGEYAVLEGCPAMVYTWFHSHVPSTHFVTLNSGGINNGMPDSCFIFKVTKSPAHPDLPPIVIRSKFWGENKISYSSYKKTANVDPIIDAVFSVLSTTIDLFFQWFAIDITVEQSFSPSFGFGSSSAMIVGLAKSIEWVSGVTIQFSELRRVLLQYQKRGSGYDIACQYKAAIISSCTFIKNSTTFVEQFSQKFVQQLWEFQLIKNNSQDNNLVAVVKPWFAGVYIGNSDFKHTEYANYLDYLRINPNCFIPTHVYANTKEILATFTGTQKQEVMDQQKHCMGLLKLNTDLDTIRHCVSLCQKIYISIGMCPTMPKYKIYKTLGAGFGDCVWVVD